MNINFDDLKKLINIAENSNINSLEVINGDQSIHIICRSFDNEISNNNANTVSAPLISQKQSIADVNTNNNADTDIDTDVDANKESATNVENQIIAPMLGTFYRRPEPTADEFVKIGDTVSKGQTLCVIEAMKIMHELKAENDCTITDILVAEGDVVEYGQALFAIALKD